MQSKPIPTPRRRWLTKVLPGALLFLAVAAIAGTEKNEYRIDWSSIDGGGGLSSSDTGFVLFGVIGQPDAGVLSGGDYILKGGFLPAPSPVTVLVGDCDSDQDIDLFDYSGQLDCFTGTNASPEFIEPGPECLCFDLDGDIDIDVHDFRVLQLGFTN